VARNLIVYKPPEEESKDEVKKEAVKAP